MSAPVAREEGNLLAFQGAENVCIGWSAKWSVLRDFVDISKAGHVVEPAAANNADFCLRQNFPLRMKVVGEA